MPTIEDTFKMMLHFGMSSLRRDVERMGEEGIETKEMLRRVWRMCIEDKVFWFGCDPDDNIRFQTGLAAVFAWAQDHRPEDAERLRCEFATLKAFALACQSGMPIDGAAILDKLEGHEPFGLRGIFEDEKHQQRRETEILPVVAEGEKQLEGRE